MKPYIIRATYTTSIEYEVPEVEKQLNIKWEDVEDYEVKWGALQLTMKCGQELEFDRFEDRGEVCYKRPAKLCEVDENFVLSTKECK